MELSAVGVLPCVTKERYNFPMPNYRRKNVPGGSFFFTRVTARRAPLFRGSGAPCCDGRSRSTPSFHFPSICIRSGCFDKDSNSADVVAGSDRKTAYCVRGSFACRRPRHRRAQRMRTIMNRARRRIESRARSKRKNGDWLRCNSNVSRNFRCDEAPVPLIRHAAIRPIGPAWEMSRRTFETCPTRPVSRRMRNDTRAGESTTLGDPRPFSHHTIHWPEPGQPARTPTAGRHSLPYATFETCQTRPVNRRMANDTRGGESTTLGNRRPFSSCWSC
jgi:hypothetical protein